MEEKEGGHGPGGCLLALLTCLALLAGASYLYRQRVRSKRRRTWEQAGKDVVVLHCLPKGRLAPSMSPYILKVATFLRYAKIPYKLDTEEPLGSHGLTPWVTLNGEEIADSEVIIERLCRHYEVSVNLSPEQQAVSTAFVTMMDHHFNWGLRRWRYDTDRGAAIYECQREVPLYISLLLPLFSFKIRLGLWHQGLGRHTTAQVTQFVKEDLQALALYLGDKPYLLGDEPSIVDCKVFGHLANLLHNYQRSPYYTIVTNEFPALVSYSNRMKERLWPDWNSCLDPPRPCQASAPQN